RRVRADELAGAGARPGPHRGGPARRSRGGGPRPDRVGVPRRIHGSQRVPARREGRHHRRTRAPAHHGPGRLLPMTTTAETVPDPATAHLRPLPPTAIAPVRLAGIGHYFPGEPITNAHFEQLDALGIDDAWIRENTGI